MKIAGLLALVVMPLSVLGFDHSAYDAILKKYSESGRFDYKLLVASRDDLASFRGYLGSLGATDPSGLVSDAERKAFWINAYNAFTIELILRTYPVESIKKIAGPFGNPWKRDFITINGRKMSLDDIEHGILRKRRELLDARVHFALVCASKGCPPLQSFAFRADKLDEQLEAATRAYLVDTEKTIYDLESDTLKLSKIMDWYRRDFERDAGSLWKFVSKYRPKVTAKTKIQFQSYDWSLNEPGG